MKLSILLIVVLFSIRAFGEIKVTFVEPSGFHGAEALYVDGRYSGNIGDTILFKDGSYRITYESKYNYKLSFFLEVESQSVKLSRQAASRSPFRECINGRISPHILTSRWGGGDLTQNTDSQVYIVTLLPPDYTTNEQRAEECASNPSLSTLKELGKATLEFKTNPTNATIIIDGKIIGNTNSIKVIPFREHQDILRVVFRKSGFANCSKDIRIERKDFAKSISCSMVKI
ncbi:MAG: hypothetical protein CMK03_14940 [Ponticaulis sp.]|nr:hypothetical protein [Ponticaulis sp.]